MKATPKMSSIRSQRSPQATASQSTASQSTASSDSPYLHVHFGAGRLGLGLVAPFFRKEGVQTWLLNRAVGEARETGGTALSSARRNELLRDHPERLYKIQEPGGCTSDCQRIGYDKFILYTPADVTEAGQRIAQAALGSRAVVVTASVLKSDYYRPVIEALNALGRRRETGEPIGRIFLVACENTVSAHEILAHPQLSAAIEPAARRHITGVHALVDRMCVGLEEDNSEPHPIVRVRAEAYGSLKLELNDETEELAAQCDGSQVEFSRHVDTEKQIKSWLLNGSHWLIALAAYDAVQADRNLKLNEYLVASPKHTEFAASVMEEMREGVAILLRGDPQYADFRREVDIEDYLNKAASTILDRFSSNEDPITRILARFQAPSAGSFSSIQAFTKRFADRVDAPICAYEAEKGAPPAAASHSFHSLFRLVASGSFIDATAA
jgi:hypothetical protein